MSLKPPGRRGHVRSSRCIPADGRASPGSQLCRGQERATAHCPLRAGQPLVSAVPDVLPSFQKRHRDALHRAPGLPHNQLTGRRSETAGGDGTFGQHLWEPPLLCVTRSHPRHHGWPLLPGAHALLPEWPPCRVSCLERPGTATPQRLFRCEHWMGNHVGGGG